MVVILVNRIGETGATGPTGAQGPTGATGKTGATGPAGESITSHYLQVATVGGTQTVAPQNDVLFALAGAQSDGIAFIPGAATVTIGEAGVYRIAYRVVLQAPADALYAVAIDGVPLSLSLAGAPETPTETSAFAIQGEAIASLDAGTTLTLRNVGEASSILTGVGPAGQEFIQASLTVCRIG